MDLMVRTYSGGVGRGGSQHKLLVHGLKSVNGTIIGTILVRMERCVDIILRLCGTLLGRLVVLALFALEGRAPS